MHQPESQHPYRTMRINTMGTAQNKKSSKLKKYSKQKQKQKKNYNQIDELQKYNLKKVLNNCNANKLSPFKIKKIGSKTTNKLLTLIGFAIQSADKAIKFIPQSNHLQAKFSAKLYYSDRQNLLNWLNNMTSSNAQNINFANWYERQNFQEIINTSGQNIPKNQNNYTQQMTKPGHFQQLSEIYKSLSPANNILQKDKSIRSICNDQQIRKQLNFLKLEVKKLKQIRNQSSLKKIIHQGHQVKLQKQYLCCKCEKKTYSRCCCFCQNRTKRSQSNNCEPSVQVRDSKDRRQLFPNQLKKINNKAKNEQSVQKLQRKLMFENRIKTQLIIKLNEIIYRISSDQDLINKVQSYVSLILNSIKSNVQTNFNQQKIKELQSSIFNLNNNEHNYLKNNHKQTQGKDFDRLQDQIKRFIKQKMNLFLQTQKQHNQFQILNHFWQKYQETDKLLKQQQQKYQFLQSKMKNSQQNQRLKSNQQNQKLVSQFRQFTKQIDDLKNDKIRLQKELSVKANNFNALLSVLKNILINWGKCNAQVLSNLQNQNIKLEEKTIFIVEEIQKIINENKKYQFQIQNKLNQKRQKKKNPSYNNDTFRYQKNIYNKSEKRVLSPTIQNDQFKNVASVLSDSSCQTDYLDSLKQQLIAKDEALIQLSQMIQEKESENGKLKIHLQRKQQKLQVVEAELNQANYAKNQMQQKLDEKVYLAESQLKRINQQIWQKKQLISQLQNQLQETEKELNNQRLNKQKLCELVDELQFKIAKQEQNKSNLLDFIRRLQEKQRYQEDLVLEKDRDIQQLQNQLAKIEKIKISLIEQQQHEQKNKQDRKKYQDIISRQRQSIIKIEQENRQLNQINQNYMQNLISFRKQIQILKSQICQLNKKKQIKSQEQQKQKKQQQKNKQQQKKQNKSKNNSIFCQLFNQKLINPNEIKNKQNLKFINASSQIQTINSPENKNYSHILQKQDGKVYSDCKPNQDCKDKDDCKVKQDQEFQDKQGTIKNQYEINSEEDQRQIKKGQALLLKNDLEQAHFIYPIQEKNERQNQIVQIKQNQQGVQQKQIKIINQQKQHQQKFQSPIKSIQDISQLEYTKKMLKMRNIQNQKLKQELFLLTNKFNYNIDYLNNLISQLAEHQQQNQKLLYRKIQSQSQLDLVLQLRKQIDNQKQQNSQKLNLIAEFSQILQSQILPSLDQLKAIKQQSNNRDNDKAEETVKHLDSQIINKIKQQMNQILQKNEKKAQRLAINAKELEVQIQPYNYEHKILKSQIKKQNMTQQQQKKVNIKNQNNQSDDNYNEENNNKNSQKQMLQSLFTEVYQRVEVLNFIIQQKKEECQHLKRVCVSKQREIRHLKQNKAQQNRNLQIEQQTQSNKHDELFNDEQTNSVLHSMLKHHRQQILSLHKKLRQIEQQLRQKQQKLRQNQEKLIQNQKLNPLVMNNLTLNLQQNNIKNQCQNLNLNNQFEIQNIQLKKEAEDLRFILSNRQLAFNNIITQKDQEIQQLKTNMCQILKNIKKDHLKIARSDSKESTQSRKTRDKIYQEELKQLKIVQLQSRLKNIMTQYQQLIDKYERAKEQIQHLKIKVDQTNIESQIAIQKYKLKSRRNSQNQNNKTIVSQENVFKHQAPQKFFIIQQKNISNRSIQSHKRSASSDKLKNQQKQQNIQIKNKKQLLQEQLKKRSARSLSPKRQNFQLEDIVPQFFGKKKK